MRLKKKLFGINIDPRNPYKDIQNPVKEFVPIKERKNREFGSPVARYPISWLNDLIGWDEEAGMWMKEIKKASPKHRRNRKNYGGRNTKHVKYMRDVRRPGKEE